MAASTSEAIVKAATAMPHAADHRACNCNGKQATSAATKPPPDRPAAAAAVAATAAVARCDVVAQDAFTASLGL